MISEAYNMDCMEYMKSIPDKFFDLAIVDPPYGIGNDCIRNNSTRTKLAKAKNYKPYKNSKKDRPRKEYFAELKRVSKNQIIFGANHLCDLFDASSSGWIVWDKMATGPFSECELAYTSFKCAAAMYRYEWNGMFQGGFGNKKLNEIRIHPSQKPVALYKWILKNYAKEGDKIFDSHIGSGSSRISCHDMGFDFYGTELDPDHFIEMEERFENHTAQGRLFYA